MHTTDQRSRPRTWRHAAYGVLATLVGLAAAHLVAALTVPAASPVLAVGSTVIDLTPTPLKEWAIRQFGSADKLVLIGSVTVVVLLLSAGSTLRGAITNEETRLPVANAAVGLNPAAAAGGRGICWCRWWWTPSRPTRT